MKKNILINSINDKYNNINEELKIMRETICTIESAYQSMLRNFNKIDKIINYVPKRQTILHKKQNISPELANFLNLDITDQLSRQEGAKMITQYCANKGLKNENNGRLINLDDNLINLFNLQNEETKRTIYVIEIDKYLKSHFQ